ncbi:MAG: PD-(D/E)XK nuclease family protein [Candidatus Ratteibacteria bacterium]|nr:PD-(D/E)XK nuclease family protein [Candidatus Ratteibacteria bacterium]
MEKQAIFNFQPKKSDALQALYDSNKIKRNNKSKFVLSPSSLNIFRDCPRCFWLQINCDIRRPRGAFPSIASGLDRVIKEYFDAYRAKEILPPLLNGKIEGKLIPHLPPKLYFNDYSKNASLMGMLDECLILPGDIYAPLDYKTRGSFAEDVHPAYQLQMDVYTLLLEKNNHKTNSLAYLLYFVPNTGQLHEGIPFNVKFMEVKTSVERALDIFHKALELLRGQMPKSSPNCEYCNWAKQLKENI